MTPSWGTIRFWAILRIALGQMQMIGALTTLLVYSQLGFATPVPQLLLGTMTATFLSILIFQVLHIHERPRALPQLMKKYFAEFFGTFALVFAGTGAIIINDVSGGAITHVGVALTFGLIVLAMIYAVGDVSGAHLNPAVTLGFFAARRISAQVVAPYIGSQILGGLAASGTLRGIFPSHALLGATVPAGPPLQSAVLELVLTAILMFVILSVSTGAKERVITAGIAVGAVIGLEAMFAGPISGASMNPARSLAPAVVAWHFENLWVYLLAPTLGALLAVSVCCSIREKGCCSELPSQQRA